MAAASNSDDASDIFWPGYVDAIANLAINLLFVIAVMAIVVLGASLQIAELMKKKDNGYLEDKAASLQMSAPRSSTGTKPEQADLLGQSTTEAKVPVDVATGPAETVAANTAPSTLPDKQPTDKTGPQRNMAAKAATNATQVQQSRDQGASQKTDTSKETKLQADLERMQERNRQLQASLSQAQSAQRAAERQAAAAARTQEKAQAEASQAKAQAKAIPNPNSELEIEELVGEGKAETVIARTARPAQAGQGATAINARANGLIVRFAEGGLELSASEASEVVTKLNTFGPVASTRWRITVVAPKGFSEALRLAYYRANSVRNALIANGVPGSAIDLRVGESTRNSADNTLVSVRPQP